jgi:DNA repair exonuclease SbcCD nuclease subunit
MPDRTPGARPDVRFLHTSDIHVSDGPDSARGLRAVADLATAQQVDLVLIAGDLFDHSRVAATTVEGAIEELARFPQPVVIIPGNHDQVDERSVYHRADLQTAGEHVTFVGDPTGREVVFDALQLVVWARGIEDHSPAHRPLAAYDAPRRPYWNVVLTHGHYVPAGGRSDRSSQINEDEIGALGCDYVALGHWHHFLDVSTGGVPAFYSGSPTMPAGDYASVNLVRLHDGADATVERVPIGAASPAAPQAATG